MRLENGIVHGSNLIADRRGIQCSHWICVLRPVRAALAVCVLLIGHVSTQAEPSHVDQLMLRDPAFRKPSVTVAFSTQLKPLWIKALGRPETEIVQVAADTIAIAHQRGMPDLEDTAPLLVDLLNQPDQSPEVTRAAVHALIALDAHQTQGILWKLARRSELDLARVIEPALAKWNYEPARDVWLSRLRNPSTRRSHLRLAIGALATTRETAAGDDLLQLVLRRETPSTIRLASARALIAVGRSNLVDEAEQLLLRRDRDSLAEVLAATILGNDSSPAAIALLHKLSESPNSGAAVIAVNELFSLDPAHLLKVSDDFLQHEDVSVRRVTAQAIMTTPSADNLQAVFLLLDDLNPSLRAWTTQRLVEFGQQEEWNDLVIGEATSLLKSASWRGIEQAVVVLTRLDHKPIALQLVSLLEHERPEVYITAAWALRELQVRETLPPMLAKAQSRFQENQNQAMKSTLPHNHAAQLSQLFQVFGVMKFREAEPLLREFVPKIPELGENTRASACWALGHIYEDNAPDELVQQLIGRLTDRDSKDPELFGVRVMCAVSLGRMNSPTAVEPLRLIGSANGPNNELGQACGWALEKLTGEPRQEPRSVVHSATSWFLTPILD